MPGFIHIASLFLNSSPFLNGVRDKVTEEKTLFILEIYRGNGQRCGENHDMWIMIRVISIDALRCLEPSSFGTVCINRSAMSKYTDYRKGDAIGCYNLHFFQSNGCHVNIWNVEVLRANAWLGSEASPKLSGLKNIMAEDRTLSPTSVDITMMTIVHMSQEFLGHNHRDTAT